MSTSKIELDGLFGTKKRFQPSFVYHIGWLSTNKWTTRKDLLRRAPSSVRAAAMGAIPLTKEEDPRTRK